MIGSWLNPSNDRPIQVLAERATVLLKAYFDEPNRIVVLQLFSSESVAPALDRFLMGVGTTHVRLNTFCEIQNLTCARVSEHLLSISDPESQLEICCHTAAILDEVEYAAWLGKNPERPSK